jgi:hypothetical protein
MDDQPYGRFLKQRLKNNLGDKESISKLHKSKTIAFSLRITLG